MSRLNLERPLRFPLNPHDQIFFLHIPKTAGTSLIDVLSHRVHVDKWFSPGENDLSPEEMAQKLSEAKLVRGHHDYRLKFSMRRPVVISFLRHPHKRSLSNFQHLDRKGRPTMHRQVLFIDPERNIDDDISLEDYLRVPHSYNKQTRMIGGFDLDEMKSLPDDVLLQVAKSHLDSMPFFGLTERFDESIQLLNYVFGWRNDLSSPQLNVKPSSQKQSISPEVEKVLEETNRLDMALYKAGNEIFEARFQQMQRENATRPK